MVVILFWKSDSKRLNLSLNSINSKNFLRVKRTSAAISPAFCVSLFSYSSLASQRASFMNVYEENKEGGTFYEE
jgi:hypothetical protein